jgi:hypothetical protein
VLDKCNDAVPRRSTFVLGGNSLHMKPSDSPSPTLEAFIACANDAFGYLFKCGFTKVPLPKDGFVNPFQVRFGNGKLVVVAQGINWGSSAEVYLEDVSGTEVPLVMFVPLEYRNTIRSTRRNVPDQLALIRIAAQRLRDHCDDLLAGNMTRFYDRATEWSRMTGRDSSDQKRDLP